MNFQDIIKPLNLTPAVETHDSPWDKGATVVAGNVPSLFTYLQIPNYLTNIVNYPRQLVFQFNIANGMDLYIVNAIQLFGFSSLLVAGGCLCVKWRQGTVLLNGVAVPNVSRYRLLDYRSDINWSGFPLYNGQLVKANFCLEFWADNVNVAKGIAQPFNLQTQLITIPSAIGDGDFVNPLNAPAIPWAILAQPFPLVFPVNWSQQAFLDN